VPAASVDSASFSFQVPITKLPACGVDFGLATGFGRGFAVAVGSGLSEIGAGSRCGAANQNHRTKSALIDRFTVFCSGDGRGIVSLSEIQAQPTSGKANAKQRRPARQSHAQRKRAIYRDGARILADVEQRILCLAFLPKF
jgi:hypothetical protein